jgi:hypothetical protein
MLIPPLLFLAFAWNAAAAEPPLAPAKVITGETLNLIDSRYSANIGASSVGIWDLRALRQIAHVELPDILSVRTPDEGDYTNIGLDDVSADGKWGLVVLQSIWTHANRNRIGSFELLLISIPDQRVVRVLAKGGRENCNDDYTITGQCPTITGARFSPDGTKILYWTLTKPGSEHLAGSRLAFGTWIGATHHHRMTMVLADLSGSVAQQRTFEGVNNTLETTSEWNYNPPKPAAGFLKDGRPALIQADGAGCVVKDMHDKQLSFLEDCAGNQNPEFDQVQGMAVARKGLFTVWDPLTGAVKGKVPATADPTRVAPSDDSSAVAELLYQPPSAAAAVRVTDAATGRVLLERPIELPPIPVSPASNPYFMRVAFDRTERRFVLRNLRDIGGLFFAAVYKFDGADAPPPALAAAAIDVDVPPASTAKADPDAYALVIGVEKYRQEGIPSVDFAAHDAQTMSSYLTGAMGFDPKNVVLLTDSQATRTDLEKNLKWLSNRVTAKSRVFVYYAGHGSPNPETGQGYLMPYEADPSYLEETAYPIAKLYASLGKLPTKDVTVVLDACFSGQGGRSLIAKGTRPLVSVVQSKAEPNTVVLAAAGSNQVSASDPEARHGLLTYYLLAGLHGEADAKHDGLITADELIAYVRPAVERAAKLQNVEQTPSLASPADASSRAWIVLTPKK